MAQLSRPGTAEPEGEEDVLGRRGCHGEPRRGRIRRRGMAGLGFCRGSAEPREMTRIAQETMKISELWMKPHHKTKMPRGCCIMRYMESVGGGGVIAPVIGCECALKPRGDGCEGHEPGTWLRAPLASPFIRPLPSGPRWHPIWGKVDCSCLANTLLENRMLRILRRDAEEIRSRPCSSNVG